MPFKLSLKLLEKLNPRYIHSHTYISVYASALDHTHATAKKVVYKWASSLWITSTVFITFKKSALQSYVCPVFTCSRSIISYWLVVFNKSLNQLLTIVYFIYSVLVVKWVRREIHFFFWLRYINWPCAKYTA